VKLGEVALLRLPIPVGRRGRRKVQKIVGRRRRRSHPKS
jgi:hypothetical protein